MDVDKVVTLQLETKTNYEYYVMYCPDAGVMQKIREGCSISECVTNFVSLGYAPVGGTGKIETFIAALPSSNQFLWPGLAPGTGLFWLYINGPFTNNVSKK